MAVKLRGETTIASFRLPDILPRSLLGLSLGLAPGLLLSAPAEAQYYAPDAPPSAVPWYELIELQAFIDGYAGVNYNLPRPQFGNNLYRSFDPTSGFALSWVGVDASFHPDPLGGTLSLRYGPSAILLADRCLTQDRELNPCDSDVGLELVQQAFASWAPGGAEGVLQFDFGKFNSIYGVEVPEAHRNLNYTRGLLFSLAQPVFHAGLRANADLHRQLRLVFLAVNGQNNTIDNNFGKTFGAQVVYRPGPALTIRLGWLGGPEQDDVARVACAAGQSYSPEVDGCADDPTAITAASYGVERGGANSLDAWRHHGDLVVSYHPGDDLRLSLNALAGREGFRPTLASSEIEAQQWFGGAGFAYVRPTALWGVGLRGEYLYDRQGRLTDVSGAHLFSGTLTADAHVTDWLQLRLDNRVDALLEASGETSVFPVGPVNSNGPRDARPYQITTTFGVIVHSG